MYCSGPALARLGDGAGACLLPAQRVAEALARQNIAWGCIELSQTVNSTPEP